MRILVTGAAGFIGGAVARILARDLTADDDDLVLTDLNEPEYIAGANFITADLTERAHYAVLPFPFDVVIHCAGILGTETTFRHIMATERANVQATLLVLESAGEGALVLQPGLMDNGAWLSPYQISKNCAEAYGLMYREYLGVDYVSVRFTVVYGPGQSTEQKKITPSFIIRALAGDPIIIYGDGSYKVRVMYIDDAAEVLVQMALKQIGREAKVDVTSLLRSNFITVEGYAKMIIGLTDSDSKIEFHPMRIGQPTEREYPFTMPDLGQTIRMNILLGTSCRETSLAEGLKKTIEYYRGLDKPKIGAAGKGLPSSAIGGWMDREKR